MPNVGFIRKEVSKQLSKWETVRDCIEGQEKIKCRREKYLPIPETSDDPTTNQKKYHKYLTRAVFFPVSSRTVDGLVGQVFSKEIAFDVPSGLEFLQSDVDGSGISLEQHSKATLEDVVSVGRGGLLVDAPTTEEGQIVTQSDVETGRFRPRIIFYCAEQIINWREMVVGGETKLSLLVLHEEKITDDDGFEFECEPRWRVYRLTDEGFVTVEVWKLKGESNQQSNSSLNNKTDPSYKNRTNKDFQLQNVEDYEIETEPMAILSQDGSQMGFIPFVFTGSTNNDSSVDEPPMYPLATLNIGHYRNSADYEQSTFLIGNPTPIFTGLTQQWVDANFKNKQITLGSASAVGLPVGADAKLLQTSENTQPMEAMKHKEDQMKAIGAKLIEPGTSQRTATEAEIEETSEASVLSTSAKNVSEAYETAIYYCSFFIDIGEAVEMDDITVQLNSEFQVMGLNAQERQEIIAAWQGGVLTWAEARDVYRRKGIATLADDEARTVIDAELAESAFSDPLPTI